MIKFENTEICGIRHAIRGEKHNEIEQGVHEKAGNN